MDNIPSEEYFDNELLKQTTLATGRMLAEFVDYIEKEFKCDKTKATFVAGILISSLPLMIEENEGGREGVQEIINDFETIHRNYGNQN